MLWPGTLPLDQLALWYSLIRPALVRSVPVEVGCVLVEDPLRVTAVVDQEPVGALIPRGPDEAFGVRVAVRVSRANLGHGDVLACEDGIERGGRPNGGSRRRVG
jgi:hypothetical protein